MPRPDGGILDSMSDDTSICAGGKSGDGTLDAMTIMTFIGFDSAWADNPKKPGAICALRLEGGACVFHPPEMVGFTDARIFIEKLHRPGDVTLVAIDQPTIVPNQSRMRPTERAVAGIVSWSGGGIQPAYRGKTSMFGDGAPIWRFLAGLAGLDFTDDPEAATSAERGGFVIEVFPALALLSLDPAFTATAKRGPRYNPARKTFRQADWEAVIACSVREASRLGLPDVAAWCKTLDLKTKPRKETQDRLDSVLCLLIAVIWRRERTRCAMIGDLTNGYIVAPVDETVRTRLAAAARERSVPIS